MCALEPMWQATQHRVFMSKSCRWKPAVQHRVQTPLDLSDRPFVSIDALLWHWNCKHTFAHTNVAPLYSVRVWQAFLVKCGHAVCIRHESSSFGALPLALFFWRSSLGGLFHRRPLFPSVHPRSTLKPYPTHHHQLILNPNRRARPKAVAS